MSWGCEVALSTAQGVRGQKISFRQSLRGALHDSFACPAWPIRNSAFISLNVNPIMLNPAAVTFLQLGQDINIHSPRKCRARPCTNAQYGGPRGSLVEPAWRGRKPGTPPVRGGEPGATSPKAVFSLSNGVRGLHLARGPLFAPGAVATKALGCCEVSFNTGFKICVCLLPPGCLSFDPGCGVDQVQSCIGR